MTWWAVGTTVVSTGAQMYGSKKVSKQQQAGLDRSIEEQRRMEARLDELLSPYSSAGKEAINPLMAELGIGGQTSTYENPLLKQIQDQTLSRLENRAAATGRNSPSDLAGIVGQAFIEPAYNMQQNRTNQLLSLMQMGGGFAANQGGMGANIASGIAGSQIGMGNSEAAGTASSMGALADGIGQFAGIMGNKKTPQTQQPAFGTTSQPYKNTVLTQPGWNQNIFGGNNFGSP